MVKRLLLATLAFLILAPQAYAKTYYYNQCTGEKVQAYFIYLQCPQLNQNQSYVNDQQIDLSGDAVTMNSKEPTAWNVDTRLQASFMPQETLYLKPISPQFDNFSKTWNFTCYPYNSKSVSAIKVVRTAYPKCVIDDFYRNAIRCTLPGAYKPVKCKCKWSS